MPIKKHDRPNDQTPPSTNKKKPKQSLCAICDVAIIEDEDDAVFCKGKYQSWLHRSCTGMSNKVFNIIASSDDPFLCLHCARVL